MQDKHHGNDCEILIYNLNVNIKGLTNKSKMSVPIRFFFCVMLNKNLNWSYFGVDLSYGNMCGSSSLKIKIHWLNPSKINVYKDVLKRTKHQTFLRGVGTSPCM